MDQSDDLVSFRLDDKPEFEDVGVSFVGNVASSRQVELTAVEGRHTEATVHDMTAMSWALHTFITPPKGIFRIDSGFERPPWRSAFFPPGVEVSWRSSPCIVGICHFGPGFLSSLQDSDEPGFRFDDINCLVTRGSDRLACLGQQVFREAMSPGFGSTLFAEAVGMQIAVEAARCDRKLWPDEVILRGGACLHGNADAWKHMCRTICRATCLSS